MSKFSDRIAGLFNRRQQAHAAADAVLYPAVNASGKPADSIMTESEADALIAKVTEDNDKFFAMLKRAEEGDPEARKFFEDIHDAHVAELGQKAVDELAEHIELRKLVSALEEAELLLERPERNS
jgi:hypothetical protein